MSQNETALPLTYHALAIEKPGAPVGLVQKTIGSLKKDEVLIRVGHASINSMDAKMTQNNIFQLPLPYVLGFDFSGEVVLLGSQGGFQVGDQVFGSSLAAGGFAECVVAKKLFLRHRGAVPAPEAATFGIAFLTAYESVVLTGQLAKHRGQWMYIAGAAGGVGHFAVQMAQLFGVKVIGSAGKASSLDLLGRMKVDHIIDHTKQDVAQEVLRITGGKGADLVYDPTYNQASFRQSAAVIARGGVYIRLGPPSHLVQAGLEDMTPVVKGRGAKLVVGDPGRYGTDPFYMVQAMKLLGGLDRAVTWHVEGKVRPLITRTVPFDPAALQAAFEEFSQGTINVGKVVVQCGPGN